MSAAFLHQFSLLPPRQTLIRRHGRPSSAIQIPLRLINPPYTKNLTSHPKSISMSYRSIIPASDRLISAISYSLPFLNSLHYARFLFTRFPAMGASLEPLLPLISAYRSLPYASFIAFFALYLGVVKNTTFSRFVRFNAMQAVVLDVLLALPVLLQRIFGVPARGLGFRFLEVSYNIIFLFTAGCFLYGIVSCVMGKTPYLPLVASAADRQL